MKTNFVNIPSRRKEYVERTCDRDLAELAKSTSAIIEINGTPNIGKSTLVANFIHRHKETLFKEYQLVGWINCSDLNVAYRHIMAIAEAIGGDCSKGGNCSNPHDAIKFLEEYCKTQKTWLLVFDQFHVDSVTEILKPFKEFIGNGTVIYTTTHSLAEEIKKLDLEVYPITVTTLNLAQTRALAKQYLAPEEYREEVINEDFVKITSGFPEVVIHVCQEYSNSIDAIPFQEFYKTFPLDQQPLQSLEKSLKTSLVQLENEAKGNPIAERALVIIKQISFLDSQPIRLDFFIQANKQNDIDALKKLKREATLITFERSSETCVMTKYLQQAIQNIYQKKSRTIIKENIERLHQLFKYLVHDLDQNQAVLLAYAPHVNYILLKIIDKTPDIELKKQNIQKIAELWSSLGRYYNRFHGELRESLFYFKKGKAFLEDYIRTELIDLYQSTPTAFKKKIKKQTKRADQTQEELLRLYAREFLFQIGRIASQLISREDRDSEIIDNLRHAFYMQVNLTTQEPIAIAYTLRDLSRALRKQDRLQKSRYYFKKLKESVAQGNFSVVEKNQLLYDQAIDQKEMEDKEDAASRDYKGIIQQLKEVEECYLKENIDHRHDWNLGTLSIYLGAAYIAAGDIEKGIGYYYQILNYSRGSNTNVISKQARAYYNLANVFYENKYYALAKMCVDKATLLEEKVYGENHKYTKDAYILQAKIHADLIAFIEKEDNNNLKSPLNLLAKVEGIVDQKKHFHDSFLQSAKTKQTITKQELNDAERLLCYAIYSEKKLTDLKKQEAEFLKKEATLQHLKDTQAKELQIQLKNTEQWYETFDTYVPLTGRLEVFADKFLKALLGKVIEKLRVITKRDIHMDKSDVAEGIINALANFLPEIEADSSKGIKATLKLPAVIQGITTTLVNRHRNAKISTANIILDNYSSDSELTKEIKNQIQEMVHYAARCYQPLLLQLEEATATEDIKKLAEYGARRVIDYQKKRQIRMLSFKELVISALRKGEGDKKLKHKHNQVWQVHGFFAKAGVKIFGEKEVYLPKKARPDIYGYRYGSSIEAQKKVQEEKYRKFPDEAAAQAALDAEDKPSKCKLM